MKITVWNQKIAVLLFKCDLRDSALNFGPMNFVILVCKMGILIIPSIRIVVGLYEVFCKYIYVLFIE